MNTNRKRPTPAQDFVNTTVRVPRSVHDRLRELAAAEHRSVSAEVRRLITEYVRAAT